MKFDIKSTHMSRYKVDLNLRSREHNNYICQKYERFDNSAKQNMNITIIRKTININRKEKKIIILNNLS